MEQGLSSGIVKKLALAGAFLVAVALLIGGEDNPGVIGQLGDAVPVGRQAPAAQPATGIERPAPSARQSPRNDQALSAWYAESETTGPAAPEAFQPAPIDHSHLINDAKPIVGTSADQSSAPVPIGESVAAEEVR